MKKTEFLKSLFPNDTIVISAVDGSKTIANAKKIFELYLDPDFKNWGLDNKGEATEETPIKVYEIVKDANYSKMFNSLSNDLDSLCLTQNQIIRFCEKYFGYLRQEGNATFFLFKENGEYHVAIVYVLSDGLPVYVRRFGSDGVWGAERHHCLVVPQLLVA